jgi:threonine/homoserine/homoserine lactone efflux protein
MENLANIVYIVVSALGIAISPVPIIVVILILFSEKATFNGIAFLTGWIAGLLLVGALILIFVTAERAVSANAFSTSTYAIKALIGFFFLLMAFKNWRDRPKKGEEPKPPKWLAKIDSVRPLESVALGAMNTSLNPKNLSLALAAGLTFMQTDLSGASAWLTPAIFIVIASSTVAVPVLYYIVSGESAEQTLNVWKAWLTANYSTILSILFLILGLQLLLEAFGSLLV